MTIWQQPATELRRRIGAGELSAREVTAAFLARIERINPKVNAIVTVAAERAMAQAAAADERQARGEPLGPLHGLPIAHKDLQATAGIRTTFGSPIFRNHIPDADSPLVARLARCGAITIGKTNTPEFGAGSQTFNPVFGATLNPYDVTRTCGGSSGGAAVALACDMLPIADGTDMGGSLRNPAAFCAVVGMRPSAALLPWSDTSTAWASLGVDGPLARNVGDLAMMLSALSGRTLGDGRLERDFRGTRLAWSTTIEEVPFDPRITEAVNAAQPVFESLGCVVDHRAPDLHAADRVFRTLRAKAFVEKHGAAIRGHRTLVKSTVLEEIARGDALRDEEVAGAERERSALRQRVADFMREHEFLVLPTTQVPPFDVNMPFVTEINGVAMPGYIDWMKSCYYISAIGHPAISVPCGFTRDGLPVGLQIVGRDGADAAVLQLAHAYERARGPIRRPAIGESERAGTTI